MARTPLPRRLDDHDENVNPHAALPSPVPTSMVAMQARLEATRSRVKSSLAISSHSLLAPPAAQCELPLTPPSSRDAGRTLPQPDGKLTSPSPARQPRSLLLGPDRESYATISDQQRTSSPPRAVAPGTPARNGMREMSKRARAAASPALDRIRNSSSSGSVQEQQSQSPNPRNRKTFRAAPSTPPRPTPSRRVPSGAEWTPLVVGEPEEDTSIDISHEVSMMGQSNASPVRGGTTGKARKSRLEASDDGDTSFLREVKEKGWHHMHTASPVRVRIVAPAKLPVRAARASSAMVAGRRSAPKARLSQLRTCSAKPRARPTPPPQAVKRISEKAVAPSSPSDDPLLIVGSSSRYGRRRTATGGAKCEIGVGSDAAVDAASFEQGYAADAYGDEDGYDGFGEDVGHAPSPSPSPSPLPEEHSHSLSRSLDQQQDGIADMSLDDGGWVSGPAEPIDDDDDDDDEEGVNADTSQSFAQEQEQSEDVSACMQPEESAELNADVSMQSLSAEQEELDQSSSTQPLSSEQSFTRDAERTLETSLEQSTSVVVAEQEYDESSRPYESDSDDGGDPEIVSVVRADEQSEAELSQLSLGNQSEENSASVERSYDEIHASAQQSLSNDASDFVSEDESEYEDDQVALVGGSKRGATPLLPPSPHSASVSRQDAYDYSLEQEESERQERRESEEREEEEEQAREQRQDEDSQDLPPHIEASDEEEDSEYDEQHDPSEPLEQEHSGEQTDSSEEVEKEISFADMSVDEPSAAMDEDIFALASPAPQPSDNSRTTSFEPSGRAPMALSRAVHTRRLGRNASMIASNDHLADLSASMSHSLHARAAMLSQHAPASIVEISSLDPRAAARASAVLKLHHRYIETGQLLSDGDAEMSTRSRILPVDVSTSYRRGLASDADGDATLDDLLAEAEAEVSRAMRGARRLQAPATPALKATYTLEAPTPLAPGAFPKTPAGRAAAAERIARATPSVATRRALLLERATKRGTIKSDPALFSQQAWRSLDDVIGQAVLLDARVLAKAEGMSAHMAKARAGKTLDAAEILEAFLEAHDIHEEDCVGEWRLSVFGARIEALQRRYLLSLEARHPGVLTSMELAALRPHEPAELSGAPDGIRDLSTSTMPAGRLSAAVNASLLDFGSPFRRGAHSTPAPASKSPSRRGTVTENVSSSQSLYPSLPASRQDQEKQAEKPTGVKARASALLGSLPGFFASAAREETLQASQSKVAAPRQPQPRAPLRQREPSKSCHLPSTSSELRAPRAPTAPPAPPAPPVARQPAAATRPIGKLSAKAPIAAASAAPSKRPSISPAELSAARSRMSTARTARLSRESVASASQHETSVSFNGGRVVANPSGSARAAPYGQVPGNRTGTSTVRPTVLAGLGTPAHAAAAQKAHELRQSRAQRNWKSPLARKRSGVNLDGAVATDASMETLSFGKAGEQSFDNSRQVWKRRETLADADANSSR